MREEGEREEGEREEGGRKEGERRVSRKWRKRDTGRGRGTFPSLVSPLHTV